MTDEEKLVAAVEAQVVAPVLKKLRKDLGRPLPHRVVVRSAEGGWVPRSDHGEGAGEIRITVKPTFKTGRYIYKVEAIFDRGEDDTGFSGFMLEGRLGLSDDAVEVSPQGRTMRYQVWAWMELK